MRTTVCHRTARAQAASDFGELSRAAAGQINLERFHKHAIDTTSCPNFLMRTALIIFPPGGPPPADERSKAIAARGNDFREAL